MLICEAAEEAPYLVMMKINLPKFVTTMTPQRISFVGGGTDFGRFYESNGGEVLSSAIDKYVYVTVQRHSQLFNEKYRQVIQKLSIVTTLTISKTILLENA